MGNGYAWVALSDNDLAIENGTVPYANKYSQEIVARAQRAKNRTKLSVIGSGVGIAVGVVADAIVPGVGTLATGALFSLGSNVGGFIGEKGGWN